MSETGRRSAVRRSVSPTALLAVLLPLLTVGALALVRPDVLASPDRDPEQVSPSRVDLVCPSGPAGSEVALAASGRATGDVSSYSPGDIDPSPISLVADAVETVARPDATFVRGNGRIAAELIGARIDEQEMTATECVLPRPEYWITGIGAGADHATSLELSNPDEGPAVADITVWGRTGQLDVPTLRGVTVPGGESQVLDLAEELPRRSELAIHVVVSRGRMAAAALDEIPALGNRPAAAGGLPTVTGPALEQLLLGLVGGEGTDTLVLSNPGTDEARVELRIVTEDASFVPQGQEEIRVSPESVETVTLTETLREQIRTGALALQVTSTAPVTAALRSIIDDDLVHAPTVTGTESPVTALVPAGDAQLVLARAGGAGLAVVSAYGDGELLAEKRVELTDGSGGTVDLPEGTDLVRVTPRRTDVSASVVVTSRQGATVVPLRELVRYALIPDVRPGQS
ncbi:MAG: DUF5719 family protein [Nocardioides sp.]